MHGGFFKLKKREKKRKEREKKKREKKANYDCT